MTITVVLNQTQPGEWFTPDLRFCVHDLGAPDPRFLLRDGKTNQIWHVSSLVAAAERINSLLPQGEPR